MVIGYQWFQSNATIERRKIQTIMAQASLHNVAFSANKLLQVLRCRAIRLAACSESLSRSQHSVDVN
jgi:hypothetical protein